MTAAAEREIDTARQDGPSTMLCTEAGWYRRSGLGSSGPGWPR